MEYPTMDYIFFIIINIIAVMQLRWWSQL